MSAFEYRLAGLAMRNPLRFAGSVAFSAVLLTAAAFAAANGGKPLAYHALNAGAAP